MLKKGAAGQVRVPIVANAPAAHGGIFVQVVDRVGGAAGHVRAV